jgi:5S rRNA maturation endonuclease (ribonuclease M5)
MKFNPRLKQDLERYRGYVIIVEGSKDIRALRSLGFEKVYAVHKPGIALKESLEKIVSELDKRDRICILTDFDKKGKVLYFKIKEILSEMKGIRLNSSLRGLLLKARISHIEGLASFFEKVEGIG